MAQAEPAFSEHIAGMPSGWRGPDDFAAVHRALLWLRERMERDKEWWRHSYLLACADALTFVVTDLLERIGIAADEDELSGATQLTASRLAITAQRASIAGDIEYARRIDAIADALASGVTPAFVPDLPDVTNREGIHIIGGAFADLRLQVAWLVEELRPSPLVLDAMGKPVDTGVGDAATYRWGLLLKDADDPSAVWDDRFADDSWFRRILTFAAKEIRLLFKLDRRDEV